MPDAPSATIRTDGQDNGFFAGLLNKAEAVVTDAGSQLADSTFNALQNASYNLSGKESPQQLKDIAEANAQSVARAGGNAQDQQRVVQETYAAANQVGAHGPVDAVVNGVRNFDIPAVFSWDSLFGGSGGSADGATFDWKSAAQIISVAAAAIFLIKALK